MHGFQNNGNTCYFNSVIQCLLHVKKLTDAVLDEANESKCAFTVAYGDLARLYFGENATLNIDILPLLKEFQVSFHRSDSCDPTTPRRLCSV